MRKAASAGNAAQLGMFFNRAYAMPAAASTSQPISRAARKPAGSVAIGGELTGIYPLELPGGWHLIGRSPLRMFDASAEPPVRLSMGDRVRFVQITPDDYARLAEEQG